MTVFRSACILLFSVCAADSATVPYVFVNFEQAQGFGSGAVQKPVAGVVISQGSARIEMLDGTQAGQHLDLSPGEPFTAAVMSGKRLVGDGKSYFECWARPAVSTLSDGGEFMDFDGAVVGFFRDPDTATAQIHAFHSTGKDEGYWLSTGLKLPVNESRAADWLRIGVVHDWSAGTWNLSVNGTLMLQGVRRAKDLTNERFELWLFGQATGVSSYDDVLITPVDPDVLEAQALAGRAAYRQRAGFKSAADKTAVSREQAQQRRQRKAARPSTPGAEEVLVFTFESKVIGGGRHLTNAEVVDKLGEKRRYGFYSPGYAADGKPLPLQVEIQCDAKLSAGMRLGDIQWAITENIVEGQQRPLPVLVHGDFSSGPTQIGTVPSSWSNKPLAVHVGELGLPRDK